MTPPVVWEVIDGRGRVWFAAFASNDAVALAFYALLPGSGWCVQSRLVV